LANLKGTTVAEKDPVELGTNLAIDLRGSTAVVTGSSRGIGKGIALTLARAGADVVAVARSETDLLALGEEISGISRRFFPVVSDLSLADAPNEVASRILDNVGVPAVLVNAAGTIVRVDPPDIEPAEVDAVFAVNVRAPLLLSQAFAAAMQEGGGGSIVNITSLAAEVVTRASIVYQASKAALVQMTKALAMRWAPEIRVNAVGPGYVETDLNREWLSRTENRSYVVNQTALGRLGDVQDVSNMVAFLASPLSSYVTGQHFIVDGGWGTPW
jgi:NAD(P)-dependent dehydrogenase (short-subunit alcohol dehydrogenase family)